MMWPYWGNQGCESSFSTFQVVHFYFYPTKEMKRGMRNVEGDEWQLRICGKKRMGWKVGYCPSRDEREEAREQPRYCSMSRVQGFEGDEVMLSPLLVSSGRYLPRRPWRSAPVSRSQNQRPGGKRRVPITGKMHRNTNCQGQPLACGEQWTSARCFASLGAALSFLQPCFHLGQSSSV